MKKKFLFWDNPKDAMIFLVLFLMLIGCVNVFSASYVEAKVQFGNAYHYLFRYLIYAAAGLAAMFFVGYKMDYRSIFSQAKLISFLLFLSLVYVDVFSRSVKGAQRWIIIGPLSVQPSEFVKLGIIILGAAYLGQLMVRGKEPHLYKSGVNFAFLVTLAMAALVYKQPDMGTAAIILTLILVLYVVAGMPPWEVAAVFGISVVSVIAMVMAAPYRLNRVKIWLDPWVDAQGYGYQAVQSMVSIGSGGLFGMHLGMGTGKFYYLPESHTDFAFAIFCQEWGFIGALCLIAIFIRLSVLLYDIGKETRDRSGYLLVTGVNFLVVGQAIANMAMVCGLLPVIGVPLTFISYGGTSLVVSLIGIGLVISVYQHEKMDREQLNQPDPVPHFRPYSRVGSSERRWRS